MQRPARTRFSTLAAALARQGGWLLFAALVTYGVAASWNTHVPNWRGILYPALWLALTAAALLMGWASARRLRPDEPRLTPLEATVIAVGIAMLLTDLTMAWQPLRDLGIYLKAGEHYLSGVPVYSTGLMTIRPTDLTNYPFLYPPLTLPFFAFLSLLPSAVVALLWVTGSVALLLGALRAFGIRWRYCVLALAWPPVFQGLWVGNVAVPALALFAIGPWLGAGLIASAIFKAYTGIGALWLVRERRWTELATGVVVVLLLVLATLPFTGGGLWASWVEGLRAYNRSQPLLPILYGFGLPRYLPFALYALLAVAAIVAAWRSRGRESLARFGVAIVVASPSLFGHGLLVAVPALLGLAAPWLWAAIGVASLPDGPQWWPVIGIAVASWLVPALRRAAWPSAEDERLHPLGNAPGPWPDAPFDAEEPRRPAATRTRPDVGAGAFLVRRRDPVE